MQNISRRKFIGQSSCAAVGSTTLLSTLANLFLTGKVAAATSGNTNDYKALVCILLAGGNDSFNMLVPRGASEYAEYATTRSNLALQQNELLAINPITSDGKQYGVHPSMPGVRNLFEAGKLAFVANAGTLVEPIADYNEYYSQTKMLPLGLYSHSDQIQSWQTSVPQSRAAIGWGGKMAEMIQGMNTSNDISMNISLAGRNVWQTGNSLLEYSISNDGNGVQGLDNMLPWTGNTGFLNMLRRDAIKDMAGNMYANIFQQAMGGMTSDTLDAFEIFQNALNGVAPFTTTFSNTDLSQSLRMVAKVVNAHEAMGVNRQTFFVTFGGWDHHDEVLNNQEYMLGVVSAAITEFMNVLEETSMSNNVTLFTISDFARTLTTNGNGSDHAWGGNAIIAGGAVNGKEIYGSYPDLYLDDNPLMIDGRGNLIPTTSADLYFAELALWMGVAPSSLQLILPNITNFYSTGSSSPPLGFLLP